MPPSVVHLLVSLCAMNDKLNCCTTEIHSCSYAMNTNTLCAFIKVFKQMQKLLVKSRQEQQNVMKC